MAKKIEVQIAGDVSGLSKAFKTAQSDAGKFGSKIGSVMGGIVKAGAFAAVAGGVVAVGAVLKAGIGEWEQQAKVASTTNAMLEATGGIANVTAGQIGDLATSIMEKTGIDDEAVQASENLLLSFQHVRNEVGKGNDVFNRATQAAVDLSVKGFGSIDSNAKKLGKALEDPVKGMSALSRAGVVFSEEQKKTIKALVDSHDTLAAQKLILDQVESSSRGVAEAYGQTLPGQMNILKEQFNNLAGTIVGAVAPAFAVGLRATNDFIQKFSDADGAAAKFKVVAGTIKDAAVTAGTELVKAFHAIDWRAIGDDLATQAKIIGTVLKKAVEGIDWRGLGKAAGDSFATAMKEIKVAADRTNWDDVGQSLARGTKHAISSISQFLQGVDYQNLFGALLRGELSIVKAYYQTLYGAFKGLGEAVIKGLWTGMKSMFDGTVSGWLNSLYGKIVGVFAGAANWLVSAGVWIISGLWTGIQSALDGVLGKIRSAGSVIKNAFHAALGPFHSPPKWSVQMGVDMIAGVGQGVEKGTPGTLATMRDSLGKFMHEVNTVQARLDAINARREKEDLASAVRNAAATLTQLRGDKKAKQSEIEAAEVAYQRAVEDIRVAAMNHEVAQAQAQADKLQTKYDAAAEKQKTAQQKLHDDIADILDRSRQSMLDKQDTWLDLMQNSLERAKDRATASWARMTDLIQRGFDALKGNFVSPAQAAINAIEDRRTKEDLQQSVEDAKQALADAKSVDKPDQDAIKAAERRLQRALEDIDLASLRDKAAAQQTAHDQEMQALQDKFTEQINATGGNMQKIIDVIKTYDGGFAEAGRLLGDSFAKSLRDAVSQAVADAKNEAAVASTAATVQAALKGHLPSFDTGGSVLRTGLAFVHRGEVVLPPGSSMGATYQFNFPNYIGSKQELVATIRTELGAKFERRNGRPAFGGA